jgi:hypothetical protein
MLIISRHHYWRMKTITAMKRKFNFHCHPKKVGSKSPLSQPVLAVLPHQPTLVVLPLPLEVGLLRPWRRRHRQYHGVLLDFPVDG